MAKPICHFAPVIHAEETHPKRTHGRRADARDAGVGIEAPERLTRHRDAGVAARGGAAGETRGDRDLAGEESVPVEADISSSVGGQKREDLLRLGHSRAQTSTVSP